MNHLNEILSISPLPIVSLENESKPMSGALTPLSSFCHRKYSESSACHDHYAGLKSKQVGQCVQCPHGLSSYPMAIGSVKYAFTGFIPYPRSGGHQERQLAKQLPEHKISRTTLDRYAGFLQGVYKNLLTAGESVIRQYSFALHEIRKLNRTIKQTIERMQMEDYQWFESADNDLTSPLKKPVFLGAIVNLRQ